MKFSSELNKNVWKVRRHIAKIRGISIYDVSWKIAMCTAKCITRSYLDEVTKKHTMNSSFEDLVNLEKNYTPTLFMNYSKDLKYLAAAYDSYMAKHGDSRRISRVYLK